MSIAKVEPLTTARSLRGPFDYRLPEEMAGVDVGSIVRVPFGRRRVLGVVVGLAERSELPPERLAEPLEALESGATPELVQLGLWVAREYCSTPSRGLQLVLPPGTGPDRRRGAGTDRAAGRDLGRRRAGADGRGAARRAAAGRARGACGRRRCRRPSSTTAVGADRAVLRRLEERGLVVTRSSTVRRRPGDARVGAAAAASPPDLLGEQRAAADSIVAALDDAAAPREHLLHGVTGSGKTEVYLAAVEAALERGRGAIVLVPEIGLAPQAVARFRARLGDRIAVLHSALSAGERHDEWLRLREGEASVCVGPRSAVFAPVRDLALIVIDEEHDPSYKQEGDPAYDARDVARRRAGRLRRGPRRRHRDAAARELARDASAGAAAARRRAADAAGLGGRHARDRSSLGPAPRRHLGGARGGQAAESEGDRDGQPARLRAVAQLPLLRPSLGLSRTATSR